MVSVMAIATAGRDRLTGIHPASQDSAIHGQGPDTGSRPAKGSAKATARAHRGAGSVAVATRVSSVAVAARAVTADGDRVEDRSADDDRFLGQVRAHRRRCQ